MGDLSAFSNYEDGGYIQQVKVPETQHYKSLSQTILNPGELAFTDGAKWARGSQLHFALQAIYTFQVRPLAGAHVLPPVTAAYTHSTWCSGVPMCVAGCVAVDAQERYGHLPEPNNEEQAREVVAQARMINDAAKMMNATCASDLVMAVDDLDDDIVFKVALHAAVELQPVATFFGGVAAQEVVKLAGKYQPLDQWLHLDWFEILPSERPTDTAPLGTRYDNQVAVFGKAFQEKLLSSTTFLVGCGALGCEMLKNFALIGIGCGAGGAVHCTDNDVIEISNLNRQFLFRSHNVGKNKSDASAAAAKIMNPALNVKAHSQLVAPNTENYFNDTFWESLTFVTNALDNIKARE